MAAWSAKAKGTQPMSDTSPTPPQYLLTSERFRKVPYLITHAYSLSHTHTLSLILSLSFSFSFTFSDSHSHTFTPSLSLTRILGLTWRSWLWNCRGGTRTRPTGCSGTAAAATASTSTPSTGSSPTSRLPLSSPAINRNTYLLFNFRVLSMPILPLLLCVI